MESNQIFYKWRPHPWHGVKAGPDPPRVVHAYIEITPFDLIKFEIDKNTGYLRVDRPQRTSSLPPSLYGFIPQTYCGRRVASFSKSVNKGDGDPLDICVISERPIGRAEVILDTRVVGVLKTIDQGKADDKIIGILVSDPLWSHIGDVADLPEIIINRINHYFRTYKTYIPDEPQVSVEELLGRDDALKIVEAAIADYDEKYKSR
ncbi:MAG: inorganic pyrophosphatase [Sedimentisphaerales bacterium]